MGVEQRYVLGGWVKIINPIAYWQPSLNFTPLIEARKVAKRLKIRGTQANCNAANGQAGCLPRPFAWSRIT